MVDFTVPVEFTITPTVGTQTAIPFMVTLDVATTAVAPWFEEFTVAGVEATIDTALRTIAVEVPFIAGLTGLPVTFDLGGDPAHVYVNAVRFETGDTMTFPDRQGVTFTLVPVVGDNVPYTVTVTLGEDTGDPVFTLIGRFSTVGAVAESANIATGALWTTVVTDATVDGLNFTTAGNTTRWNNAAGNQIDAGGTGRVVTSSQSFQGPIKVVMSIRSPDAGATMPIGSVGMRHGGAQLTNAVAIDNGDGENPWTEYTFEFNHTANGPISFDLNWDATGVLASGNGRMRLREVRVYTAGTLPAETAALITAFTVNGNAITPIPEIVANEAQMGLELPFGSFDNPINVTFNTSRNAWVTIGTYPDTTTVTSPFSHSFTAGTPVRFNVTSEDRQTTNRYIVTLTEEAPGAEFVTFSLNGFSITPVADDVVTFALPFGMDRTAVTVAFTSSPATTVSIIGTGTVTSGAVVDFTNPITFRVLSQAGNHTDYTVLVTLQQPLVGPLRFSFVDPANPAPGTALANIPRNFLRNIPGLAYAIPTMVGEWQVGGNDGNSNFRGSGNNIGSNEAASFGFEPNGDGRGLGVANVSGTVTLTMQAIAGMNGNEWGGQGENQGALNDNSVIFRIVHFGGEATGTARTIRDITLGDLIQGGTTGGTAASVTTILTLETTFATDSGFFVIQPAWGLPNANNTGTRARTRILSLNAALAPSTEANLLAFYVDGQSAVIDSEERIVTVEMPYGTANLEDLNVEFIVSRGATTTFDGDTETSPFEFTFEDGVAVPLVVTAQTEGAERTYDVTVSIEGTPNTNFLTFALNDTEIGVDTLDGGSFELPFTGTDITSVAVYFTTARNMVVTVDGETNPITSGVELDFTNPRTFMVTSTINSAFFSTFEVTATRRVASTESQLLTFTVNNFVDAVVGETMSVEVPFGTFLDAIRVTFTTSEDATVSIVSPASGSGAPIAPLAGSTIIESGDEVDFSAGPVTFIVTSEAGGTYYAEYEIEITERAGTGLAWDFRNWTDATLANLTADAAWIANAAGDRFHAADSVLNTEAGAAAAAVARDTVRANGQPIREMAGLRFRAPTVNPDRLRVDHSQQFNRLGLNGPNTELIIPNAPAGYFIAITFATPTPASERWFVPTNAKTVSEDSTTLGGNATPAWVVFQVVDSGDVSFHPSEGGLNIFRVTLSDEAPLSEDTRFMDFAVVLGDTVALTPTVGGVTHTLPFGTNPSILENVEVLFTLGDEDAIVTIERTVASAPAPIARATAEVDTIESGDKVNFTDYPVVFRVTAAAGNYADYPISIVIGNPEAYFTSFSANGLSITPNTAGMSQLLPFDANLAAVAIVFEVSHGATVTVGGNPVTSGSDVNFSAGPVTFRVTAYGGATHNDYEVTLTLAARPEFTSFALNFVEATEITSGNPGAITVELDGDLTSVVVVEFATEPADAVVRMGTQVLVSGTSMINVTSPVELTVTDEESGAVVTYVVNAVPSSVQDFVIEVISFYPNPTTDVLNITATNIRTIEVINMMGTIVISTSGSGDSHTLDVSNLSSGLHFVRVTTDAGISVGRFIKQ